jgi:hypothetical protein
MSVADDLRERLADAGYATTENLHRIDRIARRGRKSAATCIGACR